MNYSTKNVIRLGLLMGILLSIMYVPFVSAAESGSFFLYDENWKEGGRTRSFSSPFTAYLKGSVLTIQCDQQEYDLTITLTDRETGEEVYSQEVAKEASSYICIPLVGWDSGSYCLTIRNPEAGYVYGYFNL